jgi:hypothetical protein
MNTPKCHEHHDHAHGPGCGHVGIQHGDHVCYAHDGIPLTTRCGSGIGYGNGSCVSQ